MVQRPKAELVREGGAAGGQDEGDVGARLRVETRDGFVEGHGKDLDRRGVPEFDIRRILGEEKTSKLIAGTAFEHAKAVVVVRSPLTRATVMALLKLDSYLDK